MIPKLRPALAALAALAAAALLPLSAAGGDSAMRQLYAPFQQLLDDHLVERILPGGGLVSAFRYDAALASPETPDRLVDPIAHDPRGIPLARLTPSPEPWHDGRMESAAPRASTPGLAPALVLVLGSVLLPAAPHPLSADPASGAGEVTGMIHPRLSPDGGTIAVSHQGALATLPAGGGALRRITSAEGQDSEPAWSPDGGTIAFYRGNHPGSGAVMLLDAASGEVSPPPATLRGRGRLEFSPDGRRLLGTFASGGPVPRLAWADLDTGAVEALPVGPEDAARYQRQRVQGTLSADGRDVYYAVHRDEPDEQTGNRGPQCEIRRYRAGADGGPGEDEALFTWPARIYGLVAEAGGAALVVVTDLGSTHNALWRLPLEAPLAGAERLAADIGDDDRPSFDAAGHLMVWSSNSRGPTRLRAMDAATRAARDLRAEGPDFNEPAGRLSLSFREADAGGGEPAGSPLTVRVSVRREDDGQYFHPPDGVLPRELNGHWHFYAEGGASFALPAGDYRLRAFRGLETLAAEKAFTVSAGEETSVPVEMERWSHQAAEGWYSGENHVHANYGYGEWYNTPATVLRQVEGEDLNLCNAVVANSDGEAVFDREFFLGQIDPRSKDLHLVWFGQEFRSTIWGHMTFSGLTALVEPVMTGFPGTTNPWDAPSNADLALRAAERGGAVAYTHPSANPLDLYNQPYAAKGLPVDAALGRVAMMDVHGGTYERGSVELWYRLLNSGLRIVGSSGTDVFLNRMRSLPPGWARTYVHLPGGFGYGAWIEGQTAGRSFFTSGPVLRFSVEGQAMGGRLALAGPGPVRVEARAESAVPLERVELVCNGAVLRELELAPDRLSASFDGEAEAETSGWIALRAVAEVHPDAVRGVAPAAHTNPVWIEIPGRPNPETPRAAAYFLKWIDRLEADLLERDRFPSAESREGVLRQLEAARAFYRPHAG